MTECYEYIDQLYRNKDLNKLLVDLKGEPYSIYSVDKILNEIDHIYNGYYNWLFTYLLYI